jgi:RND family efflux transporter MFP subunit
MKAYILLIAAVPALAGCHGKQSSATPEDAPAVDVAYPAVDSVVLHKKYPAYLTSNKEVELVARVNGFLLNQPYKSGAFVKKGTVLFEIEDRNYRDALRQAESQLASAKATNDYAASHYAAVKRALESDAVSAMEVEQAKSALREAEAAVRNAEAAVEQARTNLSYCTVVAPFDGSVSLSNFNDGAYLSGEGSPVALADIFDNSSLNVNFHIPDKSYIDMLRNKSQALGVDLEHIPLSFSDSIPHRYTCALSYMAPEIDKATGTLLVRATVQNPYGELRSGMYAELSLPYATDPQAVLVKDASIATDQRGKYVYTVNDSSKVVYTPVEVGELVDDTMRIITSGLGPHDRYVTKALLKVRDSETVNAKIVH